MIVKNQKLEAKIAQIEPIVKENKELKQVKEK